MTWNRIVRGLAAAGLASVLIYVVLALLTDAPAVMKALGAFPVRVFLGMLALALACFGVRGVRWWLLMRTAGAEVGLTDALYLQLAGQTMTVTPGRVGEVFKPWIARETVGFPMARGVALVVAERVADVLALCILSFGGLSMFLARDVWVVATMLVFTLAAAAVARSEWFHNFVLGLAARQRWMRKHESSLEILSVTLRSSLEWRTFWWSVSLSVLAWGFEGFALFLCVQSLEPGSIALLGAVAVYSVSTIAGALSLLPGGVGFTEASMAGLLVAVGMEASSASAATLITRAATLWWGTGVGWLALASRPVLLRTAFSLKEDA